jgi:hypothetical protein
VEKIRTTITTTRPLTLCVSMQLVMGALLLFAGAADGRNKAPAPEIPQSVRLEHAAIHTALVHATTAGGAVGAAVKALTRVLYPHFAREEEIALPPLGLLARLANGTRIPEAEMTEALAMSDALKRELPQMLDEHTRVRAAIDELRRAATAAHDTKAEQLAADLTLHAQTEEEVMYPAAILVGELIRAKTRTRRD